MDKGINYKEARQSYGADKHTEGAYRPPWRDGGGKNDVSDQPPNLKRIREERLHERLQYDKLDNNKLKRINDALCSLAIKWEATYKKTQSSEANNSAQSYFDAVDMIDDFIQRDPSPEKWNEIVTSDNSALKAVRYVLQHDLDPKIAFGLPTGGKNLDNETSSQKLGPEKTDHPDEARPEEPFFPDDQHSQATLSQNIEKTSLQPETDEISANMTQCKEVAVEVPYGAEVWGMVLRIGPANKFTSRTEKGVYLKNNETKIMIYIPKLGKGTSYIKQAYKMMNKVCPRSVASEASLQTGISEIYGTKKNRTMIGTWSLEEVIQ